MIYMMTRLIVNLSQVYIPLYITDTLFLDKVILTFVKKFVYNVIFFNIQWVKKEPEM